MIGVALSKNGTDTFRMSLRGERIQALREALGMSQEELAKLVGLQRQAIYTYETGSSQPSVKKLKLIVDVLKTNSSYLLGELDYPGQLTERENRALLELYVPGTRRRPSKKAILEKWLDNIPDDEKLGTPRK